MKWVLIWIFLSGTSAAPATMPTTYPTKEACVEDGQRWVEFMANMPNELEPQWEGRRGVEWVCFEQKGTN